MDLSEHTVGQQNENEDKILTCITDSSNPPVVMAWLPEEVNYKATTTYQLGDNNGHNVHSKVSITLTRDMNGMEVSCKASYNSDAGEDADAGIDESRTISLDVICKKNKYIILVIRTRCRKPLFMANLEIPWTLYDQVT